MKLKKNRNWHYCWSKFYFYKKNYNYFYALSKITPNFFRSLISIIKSFLKRDTENYDYAKAELGGIISSIFNKNLSTGLKFFNIKKFVKFTHHIIHFFWSKTMMAAY